MLYYTKGNVIDDYIIGITVTGWVVRVLDLALSKEPSKQFWKVEEEGSQLKPEAAEQKALPDRWPWSIFARFWWAMDLLLSLLANIQAKTGPEISVTMSNSDSKILR
ncbi:hypothetical protein DPV78_000459 [Talaromyces pinophilus]|jgi:hypothetical protein|nr:hypothetical protein DPV78_000459 [Talaromyces pinophilus]